MATGKKAHRPCHHTCAATAPGCPLCGGRRMPCWPGRGICPPAWHTPALHRTRCPVPGKDSRQGMGGNALGGVTRHKYAHWQPRDMHSQSGEGGGGRFMIIRKKATPACRAQTIRKGGLAYPWAVLFSNKDLWWHVDNGPNPGYRVQGSRNLGREFLQHQMPLAADTLPAMFPAHCTAQSVSCS